MTKHVRYVNFYPPRPPWAAPDHPWQTTSWVDEQTARAAAKPGALAIAVEVEFDEDAQGAQLRPVPDLLAMIDRLVVAWKPTPHVLPLVSALSEAAERLRAGEEGKTAPARRWVQDEPFVITALKICRDKFLDYERQHLAKGAPGKYKAAVNGDMAGLCSRAINSWPFENDLMAFSDEAERARSENMDLRAEVAALQKRDVRAARAWSALDVATRALKGIVLTPSGAFTLATVALAEIKAMDE